MKQLIIILTAVVGFTFTAFSQTVKDSSSRIIVYESYVPSAPEERPKLKNFVAISPLSIFIGDFPLTYERNIVGPLNIMVGAGVTSKNYLYDIFSTGDIFSGNTYYSDNFNRTSELGHSWVIEPKIYLKDRYFHGIYLGMEYKFRRYNYISTTYDDPNTGGTVKVGDVKEHRNVADVKFNCGWAYNLGSNVVIDFFIGVGTRTNTYYYAEYNTATTSSSNTNSGTVWTTPTTPTTTTNTTYRIDYLTQKRGTVTLSTGFRIGYAF